MRTKLSKFIRRTAAVVAAVVLVIVLGFAGWLLIGKTGHQAAAGSPAPLSVQLGPLEIPTWTETFTVATGSMTGYADPGSVVLVNANARHTPEAFKAGDVVSFYLRPGVESSRITHRIVDVMPAGAEECGITDELLFRTKGDANEFADPYCIRAAQITGQVTAVLPPAFGVAPALVRQNMLPIAAAGLLLVAGAFLVSGLTDARRNRREAATAAAAAPEETETELVSAATASTQSNA